MAYDSREAISGSMTLDEIRDAPQLPKGHYYATISRFELRENVEMTTRQGKRMEATVVDFVASNFRPASDVDPDRLDGIDLASYELTRTFWYTPTGMPELRDFMRSFKFPGGVPVDSLYHETVGREVLCSLVPDSYTSKRSGKTIATTRLVDMVATESEATTKLA